MSFAVRTRVITPLVRDAIRHLQNKKGVTAKDVKYVLKETPMAKIRRALSQALLNGNLVSQRKGFYQAAKGPDGAPILTQVCGFCGPMFHQMEKKRARRSGSVEKVPNKKRSGGLSPVGTRKGKGSTLLGRLKEKKGSLKGKVEKRRSTNSRRRHKPDLTAAATLPTPP